ncbi:MAG TPA: potassium channel family protein [Stellaceae bacterium]|nr:potassium channel family protein [Stellaceae bacterium]
MTLLLVIEFLVIFVLIPFYGMSVYTLRSTHVPIASGLAVATVAAIARGRIALILTLFSVAIAIGADILRYEWPSHLSALTFLFAALAFLFIVTGVVGQVVFGPGRVTSHRVQGAVVLYLHFALIFAYVYALVLFLVPGAFGELVVTTDELVGGKLLYFSFTTLTTVGYGDIVPLHPFARSIANLEAIIGQLYPATLLARIVTLEVAARRE